MAGNGRSRRKKFGRPQVWDRLYLKAIALPETDGAPGEVDLTILSPQSPDDAALAGTSVQLPKGRQWGSVKSRAQQLAINIAKQFGSQDVHVVSQQGWAGRKVHAGEERVMSSRWSPCHFVDHDFDAPPGTPLVLDPLKRLIRRSGLPLQEKSQPEHNAKSVHTMNHLFHVIGLVGERWETVGPPRARPGEPETGALAARPSWQPILRFSHNAESTFMRTPRPIEADRCYFTAFHSA